MGVCLRCGGTGITAFGEKCDCGAYTEMDAPICLSIPVQYQGVKFSANLVPTWMPKSYGTFMENLLDECTRNPMIQRNYIICSPPNTGKTVWAYSLYSQLYSLGITIPDVMDLMQARDVFLNLYYEDKATLEKLSASPIAIIKLPWDLPNKFPETISTIVERRVMTGCSTIFLFNGTKGDLTARDSFGKLTRLLGDGSYNSVCLKVWEEVK